MSSKNIGLALVASALAAVGATGAQAKSFDTLGAIPAQKMSVEQMKAVEGKAHIYLLVDTKVEVSAAVEAVLRAAAPTPASGLFRRSPSRDAAAFDFLPPPPTPTRI